MSLLNIRVRLPDPPKEYEQAYMDRLVLDLEQALKHIATTRQLVVSSLRLEDFPTSSAGLVSGSVWNDSGTLKVVP